MRVLRKLERVPDESPPRIISTIYENCSREIGVRGVESLRDLARIYMRYSLNDCGTNFYSEFVLTTPSPQDVAAKDGISAKQGDPQIIDMKTNTRTCTAAAMAKAVRSFCSTSQVQALPGTATLSQGIEPNLLNQQLPGIQLAPVEPAHKSATQKTKHQIQKRLTNCRERR